MGHPLLLLGGSGRVHSERLAPGADQPAILKLCLVIKGLQFHLQQTHHHIFFFQVDGGKQSINTVNEKNLTAGALLDTSIYDMETCNAIFL
jgi:hypothetical protein